MRGTLAEKILLRLAVLVVVAGVWEAAVLQGLANAFWVGQPSKIALRLLQFTVSLDFWRHFWVTAQETIVGFAVGSALGIAAAFLLAYSPRLQTALDPYIMGVYCMPRVALAPLFIMWFGIGLLSKVMLIVSIVFFNLYFTTYSGVRSVDVDLVNAMRTMGASSSLIIRRVVLPWCVPWIFSGLKIAIGFALIGAVVGEMLAAQWGLGFLIARAAGGFDTNGVLAVLIVLAAKGAILYVLAQKTEQYLLRWQPTAAN